MNFEFFLTAFLQGLGYAALGIGVFLSLRIFNIPDITTDGSFTLGGAITAIMITSGFHPLTAMLVAITGGMLSGASTGMILTRFKIHPLLAGILVMTALYSINLVIMGRSNIPLINTTDVYTLIPVENKNTSFAFTLFLVTMILILLITWLLKTDFGIAMRATGNSEAMVRSMGVNTSWMKIVGLAIANGFTALSGFLIVQYQGFADINMGIGIVISGLGSVMIGEALMQRLFNRGIIYNILAVVAGCVLFKLIIAAALAFGLNPNYLKIITALIVLTIVALSSSRIKSAA